MKNNSDEFHIGHCRIKVKVTAGTFSSFTTIQTVKSYYSGLIYVMKCVFVNLNKINPIYEYSNALVIWQPVAELFFHF